MKTKKIFSGNRFGWLLVALGSVGLFASMMLSYEKYSIAVDPTHIPSCSINPILDCGTVLASGTDSLILNIPNAFFGIAAFSALITVGVTMLAGAKLKDWFLKIFYGGILAGLMTTLFFIGQSYYDIGSICIYCMTTWLVIFPLFTYSTIYLVEQKILHVPKFMKKAWPMITNNHLGVVVVMYLIVFGLALFRFRDYFETVIG